MITGRVTSKAQTTIPQPVRAALGIRTAKPTAFLAAPSDSAVLRGIGQVAVAATHLDFVLRRTIGYLRNQAPADGDARTQYDTAQALRRALRAAADERRLSAPQISDLDKLQTRVECAQDERNLVLHGLWTFDPDSNVMNFHSARNPSATETSPTAESLATLTQELQALTRDYLNTRFDGRLDL